MMADFGDEVHHEGWQHFVVPARACYRSPGRYHVEGDASSASYFLALGAIGGGPIQINGVGSASVQGDVQFAQVRSEEHTSELQSRGHLVCRLLLEKNTTA